MAEQTIADRALELYDREGEEFMLAFLHHTRKWPDDELLWDESGTCLLLDSSSVAWATQNRSNQYRFRRSRFASPSDDEYRQAYLPRLREHAHKPEPSIPMAPTPNTDSIVVVLLQVAEDAVSNQVDFPVVPIIDERDREAVLAIMDAKAPGARRAINDVIRAEPPPPQYLEPLNELQMEYAFNAIEHMPEGQYERLVAWLKERAIKARNVDSAPANGG